MAAPFPDILALGEAMIEFNQSQPGCPEFLQGFGGDTSNFCIAAARQGASAGFVSAVGDDHFGRLLNGLWLTEGVDTTYVRVDRSAPTGVYFVTHGPNGHQFDYLRAGSAASRYASGDLPSTRSPPRRRCTCRASASRSARPRAMPRSRRSTTRASRARRSASIRTCA